MQNTQYGNFKIRPLRKLGKRINVMMASWPRSVPLWPKAPSLLTFQVTRAARWRTREWWRRVFAYGIGRGNHVTRSSLDSSTSRKAANSRSLQPASRCKRWLPTSAHTYKEPTACRDTRLTARMGKEIQNGGVLLHEAGKGVRWRRLLKSRSMVFIPLLTPNVAVSLFTQAQTQSLQQTFIQNNI
jgi:hypothetical protein